MILAQYADKGTKIKDNNTIALQWPLIGGALMSSDTARLGPEGQQATFIDEEYLNDNGEKTSVSKALYPDGYRSISILNDGKEFIQGYRPDGSINYTVTPEQFKKDTMNYFDYTRQIPKGQKGLEGGIQPGVYYVNFPTHKIGMKGGSNDTSSEGAWNSSLGRVKLPLGHAGVMTVDANGNTQYYEYGRYSGGLGAVKSMTDGNWRRKTVPDAVIGKNGEIDHTATADAMARTFGKKVELTFVDNANPNKTLKAIQKDYNNARRSSYNLATKTCGSEACDVINAGQSGWENFVDTAKRTAKAGFHLAQGAVGLPQFLQTIGGFRPSAKQGGLEAAGYRTYSSK